MNMLLFPATSSCQEGCLLPATCHANAIGECDCQCNEGYEGVGCTGKPQIILRSVGNAIYVLYVLHVYCESLHSATQEDFTDMSLHTIDGIRNMCFLQVPEGVRMDSPVQVCTDGRVTIM